MLNYISTSCKYNPCTKSQINNWNDIQNKGHQVIQDKQLITGWTDFCSVKHKITCFIYDYHADIVNIYPHKFNLVSWLILSL